MNENYIFYPEDNRNEKSLVSVIIPCYNCELLVSRAIESVINQQFKNWELLLIENNSSDETEKVLNQYQSLYPGKIRIYFEKKKGAPAARNKGLKNAKGDWIQFLDADDELLPEKISSQLKIALENKISFVASPYTIKGIRNNLPFQTSRDLQDKDFWLGLIHSKLGITSANLFNRELLLKVNGWNEDLVSSQEYDLMFRILQLAPAVGFDNKNLTIIYIGVGESVSRVGDKDKAKEILESRIGLRLRIKEYLKANGLLTKERAKILEFFIYKQLYLNYRFRPEYVKERLRSLKLNLPLNLRLKGIYFMFKMDSKRILKIKYGFI